MKCGLPFCVDICGAFMSAGRCAIEPDYLGLMTQCQAGAKTRESGCFEFLLPD